MNSYPKYEDAVKLLLENNDDAFLLRHAATVAAAMDWFAREDGFAEEAGYWKTVGLLHDVDYQKYPEEHCRHAPGMLTSIGADDAFIHAVVSHGYGIASDVEPAHHMEKVLFAVDELTGIIYAATLMRPSKSARDMDLKSLKKKYKDKKFAAGCSREVIAKGAEMLGIELDDLLTKTLRAMQDKEEEIQRETDSLCARK